MKLDLMYEVTTDNPLDPQANNELFHNVLDQIELADKVGFNCVWAVEHHFLIEFSHSSAPEVLFGAISQRTERIRIGVGVTLLPYPFNHPIRVAERIATLDQISNGRVEFGTGRSSEYEQAGFEIAPQESRAMWQEALEIIPRMWREHPFSYEGRFFKIPERHIVPPPLQDPHPPIWMACTSPDSWRLAAANGVGALGFSFLMTMDEFRENITAYRENINKESPVGALVNEQVGGFTLVHCADDDEQARETAFDPSIWYVTTSYKNLAPQTASGGHQILKGKAGEFMTAITERSSEMYKAMNENSSIVIGDPDRCIARLKAYEDVGMDRVLCFMQMRGIPHEKVMRSIELFGKEVIPAFQ